jgi:hypothetical protein
MKIDLLSDLLIALVKDNPSWKELTKNNLNSYYEVLEPIPNDVFQKAAMQIRRTKFYGWPGAGEIYQICKTFMEPDEPKMTKGEILWGKTVDMIRNRKHPHDDWPTAQALLDFMGVGIQDILEADSYRLDKIQRQFVKWIDSGLVKRRNSNGEIIEG